jgi:hypothetical protein
MAKSHVKLVTQPSKNEQLRRNGVGMATYGPTNT